MPGGQSSHLCSLTLAVGAQFSPGVLPLGAQSHFSGLCFQLGVTESPCKPKEGQLSPVAVDSWGYTPCPGPSHWAAPLSGASRLPQQGPQGSSVCLVQTCPPASLCPLLSKMLPVAELRCRRPQAQAFSRSSLRPLPSCE